MRRSADTRVLPGQTQKYCFRAKFDLTNTDWRPGYHDILMIRDRNQFCDWLAKLMQFVMKLPSILSIRVAQRKLSFKVFLVGYQNFQPGASVEIAWREKDHGNCRAGKTFVFYKGNKPGFTKDWLFELLWCSLLEVFQEFFWKAYENFSLIYPSPNLLDRLDSNVGNKPVLWNVSYDWRIWSEYLQGCFRLFILIRDFGVVMYRKF